MIDIASTRKIGQAAFVLCIAGLAFSTWMTYLHIRSHIDPLFDTSGVFFGGLLRGEVDVRGHYTVASIPTPILNIAYYLISAVLIGMFIVEKNEKYAAVAFVIGLLKVLVSSAILIATAVRFGSYCAGCISVDLIDVAFLILIKRTLANDGNFVLYLFRQVAAYVKNRWVWLQLGALGVLFVVAGPLGKFPRYWECASWRTGVLQDFGINGEHLPWIGVESASIIIDEFFDYECPACRSSHQKVRRRLLHHNKKIRLIRHDFSRVDCVPNEDNPDRCIDARAAFCAMQQNRYWEFNDALIAKLNLRRTRLHRQDILDLTADLKIEKSAFVRCLVHPDTYAHVQAVRKDGLKRQVTSTPTYFLNREKFGSKKILQALDNLD